MRALLMAVATVLFCSCYANNEGKDGFPVTRKLKGTPWEISESLGEVHNMVASDDYLVIRDYWDESAMTLVGLKDHGDLHHFGLRGDGPQYIVRCGTFMIGRDSIGVYDGGKNALLSYALDDIRSGIQTATGYKRVETRPSIVKMKELQDSFYLSTGIFDEGRMCLMDNTGKILSYQGEFPESEQEAADYPAHVKCVAYLSDLCVQPHGSRSALATQYGGIIQIHEWDLQKGTATEVARVNRFSPQYKAEDYGGTPNFHTTEQTRWGYLSVDANDRYIFALYSGKLNREDGCMMGNKVHVYDWDGNPVCMLKLDCSASCLVATDSCLYAMSQDSEGVNDIVEYQINF